MRPKLLAALLVTAAAAQDLPVIKVTTRLVEISVVARDVKGPVRDLTKDDFTVLDQGRPQKIAIFQINAASRDHAAEEAPDRAPASNGGVFTNQQRGSASAVSTVILLDGLMISTMDALQTKAKLRKYLQEVPSGSKIALFVSGGQLQLAEPFTDDSAQLIKALDLQQWGSGNLPNALKPTAAWQQARALPNAELAAITRGVKATFISRNSSPTAQGIKTECIELVTLARYLARFPGRKNLLWITGGFPLVKWGNEPEMYTDEVSQVNHAFSDAQVAVYPIDARGMMAAAPSAPVVASPSPAVGKNDPGGLFGGKGAPGLMSPGTVGQDTFNYIAHFTGGEASLAYNDIAVPIRRVALDSAVTYTLAFYPDAAMLDSKRHTLEVKVDRKGLDLQYRQGYTATPEPPENKVPEKAEVTEAIWSPVDSTGIAVSARPEKVNEPQPGMVRLDISLAAGDLAFQSTDKGWASTLAVVYDQRSADGRDLGRISETLNLEYDQEHYQQLGLKGVTFPKLVHPSPEASQIRIVIYDRNSGRVGSLAVKL